MACVRQAHSGDELVECDNISKGGRSFRSRKSYAVDSQIDVAAPYSPGWDAIFVPACIKHVETLPSGTLFRYGVAYTPKTPRLVARTNSSPGPALTVSFYSHA
jgi:hypothetical protein